MEKGDPNQQSELPAEDRDLVLSFQEGHDDAYDAIYRRHEARVRAVCTRMLGQREDSQEAVQDTFVRAYLSLGKFNGQYQLGAWLTRIATNVCVDRLRSRSRHGRLALVPLFDSDIPDPSAEPEELVVERDPRVHDAIVRMRPLHVHALEMREVQGLSHVEMAGRLSMTPAQVKALLHRARRSFRRAFEHAGNWVVAPLLGMRTLTQRVRDSAAGSDSVFLSTTPAGSALAERAVAGAIIAVLTFTGAPIDLPRGAPQRPLAQVPTEQSLTRPAHVADDNIADPALRAEMASAYATEEAPGASSEPAEKEKKRGLLGDVAAAIQDAPPSSDDPPPEDGEGEPSLGVPTASGTDEVVQQAKDVLDDAGVDVKVETSEL